MLYIVYWEQHINIAVHISDMEMSGRVKQKIYIEKFLVHYPIDGSDNRYAPWWHRLSPNPSQQHEQSQDHYKCMLNARVHLKSWCRTNFACLVLGMAQHNWVSGLPWGNKLSLTSFFILHHICTWIMLAKHFRFRTL